MAGFCRPTLRLQKTIEELSEHEDASQGWMAPVRWPGWRKLDSK